MRGGTGGAVHEDGGVKDLQLFAQMFFKLGMLCGFIPSIIFVCAAEAWRKAQRVPARNLYRKVVSDVEKQKRELDADGDPSRRRIHSPDAATAA